VIERLQSFSLQTQAAVGDLQPARQTCILTPQLLQLALLASKLRLRTRRRLRKRLLAALRELFSPGLKLITVEVLATQQRAWLSPSTLISLGDDA
jgi:hypothetical protein